MIKRLSMTLRVLVGLSVFVHAAVAQGAGVTCTAFVANQPTLRQEGTTEPVGDIMMNCSGMLVGAQTGPQTLTLFVSGAITSRQLYSGSAPPTRIPTEATLLINEKTTAPTQGFLQNGALSFSGFLLPSSGAPFPIRVTNIRVNANVLAAGAFVTGAVLATFPVQNNSNLVLGAIQSSLSVSVCTPLSTSTASTTVSYLTISELVNTAFKAPNVSSSNSTPGGWYQSGVNTESQAVIPSAAGFINQTGAVVGQADAATRFRVNFSIPSGVTLQVPVVVPSGTTGSLVAMNGGDLGAFSMATGPSITQTSSGSVTYEVRSQNAASIDSFAIPVTVTSTPNPGTGPTLVSATYAPTTAEVTSLNGQIPRFADTSHLTPVFSSTTCPNGTVKLSSITPNSATARGPAFTLTANGSGFPIGTSITWNGSSLPTNFVSTSQLTATVQANLIGTPGMASVGVSIPGQTTSPATLAFMINGPLVIDPPKLIQSFGASTIPLNGTTSLTFGISNPNPTSGLTGVSFTDALPPGLVVATPNGLTGSCGGSTITAAAGSSSVSLTGAALSLSNPLCSFSLNVQGTTAGVKNNIVNVSSIEGGTGSPVTASLNVINLIAPSITKSFRASSIMLNGTTSLSFNISNPNANSRQTDVSFTDSFPSGLVVATPNGLTGSCGGGTITVAAGSTSVSLSGATLAANGSCSFSVNVRGTTVGTKNNSVTASSTEGGSGPASTAMLLVLGSGPTITAYSPTSVPAASAAFTLTLTGTNYCNASQVMWNSTGLATGYVSSTSLTASVPANLLTAPTIASISVVNPAGACPPGGTSPAVNFVVAAISSPPNLAIIVQPSLVQPVAPAQSTTPLFNTVNVRNVDGSTLTTPLATSVFTVSGGNWLATIPQTSDDLQQGVVRFTTDPTGLAQGSYLGYILYPSLGGTTGSASGKLRPFAAPSCNQVSTAVIFTAGSPALTFSPSYPALTAGAGGAAAISIDVTVNQITQGYSPPIPIRVAATSNEGAGAPCWLSISPLDTPLQTDMRFQATASSTNLNPGVHHGFLTAQGGGTTASDVIFFTNTASGTPVLDAGNDLITIDSATGMGAAHLDSTPTSLPFTATCNGCAGTTLTAACSGCQSVAAGQVNGMTPADLTVTLDPASLSLFVSGQASVAISSSGAANLTIPVTKAPASLPNGPQIFPGGIVSAGLSVPRIQTASLNAILSIFGQNFASAGTSRMVATGDLVDGLLPTNLGGVCVLFGDQRAPIFLVTPGQLNVQAPELPGSDNVPVQVLTNCDAANQVASASVMLAVQAAAPEFFYFAITPGGNNPIAATDGVTNAPIGDPSRLGTGFTLGYPDEVVVIYATGLGLTTPPFAPGQLPSSSAPVTGVTVAIDSAPVDPTLIQYAGVTPGLAGLYQLNLELPAELAPGDHTITISVNGISSPAGPYISTGPPPM